jgi:hypothetical protein
MNKCSSFLAIKEMQIKTMLRFDLTPVRTATSRNQTTTNVGEDEGKEELSYTAGQTVSLVQPLWKTVWKHLKKLKIKLPYDPVIPLLEIYL